MLTLHIQHIPYWFDEFVARCQGRLGYVVAIDTFPEYVDVKVLGRTYLPDNESNALVDQGAAGADKWIDRFSSIYSANPHVHKWIGPNEYVLWDHDKVDRFNAFHVRFIERMSQLGHGVACGQINTGWMRLRKYGDPPPYPESIAPVLAALWAHNGLFSTHEYWPGEADPTGNILRFPDFVDELLQAGVTNLPDFAITETGVDEQTDDPASDFGHWGWRHFYTWPEYFDMLKWYSGELDRYPYMKCASIFTVGNWPTFNIEREEAMDLADFIAQDEPVIERAHGLDVASFGLETINWDLVWDAGYRWVGIRFTGPNADRSALIVDPSAHSFHEQAGNAGLLRLGYHGLMPDVGEQAKTFAEAVGGRTLEMGQWSDIENMALTDQKCADHLKAMDRWLGQPLGTGVYTNLNFMLNHSGEWAAGRDAWLAAWTGDPTADPIVPEPFTDWTLYQWTNQGIDVPGVSKRICLDVYNGTEVELYEEYGTPNGGEEPDVKIYDLEGNERDWQWVQDTYGDVTITKPTDEQLVGAKGVFRITKLQEVEASLDLNCHVDGGIDQDDRVAFYWPGAPGLDEYDPPTARWEDQALQENIILGTSTLLMGGESDYNPETERGAYGIWPLKPWMASEYIKGLGWLMATHYRHLDVTFELFPIDDPEPTPTGSFKVTGTITLDLVIETVDA